jgi:hypothetical protein
MRVHEVGEILVNQTRQEHGGCQRGPTSLAKRNWHSSKPAEPDATTRKTLLTGEVLGRDVAIQVAGIHPNLMTEPMKSASYFHYLVLDSSGSWRKPSGQ